MRKQTCLPKWNCCEWGSLFFNPCFSPCSAHAHIKRKLYVFNQHFSGQLHAIVSANYSMTRLLIESTDTGGHSDRLQAMGRLDRLVSYRDPNATFPLWGKTSLSGEKPQTFFCFHLWGWSGAEHFHYGVKPPCLGRSLSEAGAGPWPKRPQFGVRQFGVRQGWIGLNYRLLKWNKIGDIFLKTDR